MSSSLKVGLIGYGMAGKVFHAPIITSISGLNLTKIRETKPDNIAVAKSRNPSATIVKTSEEILSDPDIDLVVIATPNTTHYLLAKEALIKGKHVVVDKPFTITSTEADDLIKIAKQANKLLSVYHNRRWDSGFKTVQRVINEKSLGRLVEVEIHFDRFRPNLKENAWREKDIPGSGILYDLGSHLLDQSLVFFGIPKTIMADIQQQRLGAVVDDYFHIDLHYENLKVILKAGMLVKETGPQYILHGEKGSFIKYGLDVQENALSMGKIPNKEINWGKEPENLWGKLVLDIDGKTSISSVKSETGDYRGYYKNIYQSILGREKVIVTPEQARDVIKLIELAKESARKSCHIIPY